MKTMNASDSDAIAKAVRETMNEIEAIIQDEGEAVREQPFVPTIFVGRISPRKAVVGWNFQDKTLPVGAPVRMPHPEDFYGTPVKHGAFC